MRDHDGTLDAPPDAVTRDLVASDRARLAAPSSSPATFYAHTGNRPDRNDWQPLQTHLANVGSLAASFASSFGAASLGGLAGVLHDVGKYTAEFQRRLDGDVRRVDHSTWGARIARERYGPLGNLLAYGIAGHHAGLANGHMGLQRTALRDRLEAMLPELVERWQIEIQLPELSTLAPDGFTPRREMRQFQLAFLGRMLFSCLVDADYLDTEAFYDDLVGLGSRRDGVRPALPELRSALNEHLSGFHADTPVNALRASILAHVRGQASQPPGLFSLTVPTGGGKTLASLAFALDHAVAHGLQRVIYVIPFTSIVEQTASVFRAAFGSLGERAVLEHHGAFIDAADQSPQGRDKLRLAMENWDAPVVVTTAVQFFESLFADRPAKCRKLHAIARSVVILDEAQTLPIEFLRPCVAALDELALNYRTSVVLCTATQPALEAPRLPEGLKGVRELAPDPPSLYEALRRVRVRHAGPLSDAEITSRIRDQEQVLCIVNNRRHARALANVIDDCPGAFHLTTLMCAKHRSAVLAEIRRRLRQSAPCRLVATSLIEAGVDVDFPSVLRAEAGLDSIAQAAGRCNREGRRPAADSVVLIFRAEDQWQPPPELRQAAQAARTVLRQAPDDPLSLSAIQAYFGELYWQKGVAQLDAHALLDLIGSSTLDGLPFETVASKFRLIESQLTSILIPYDVTARALLDQLARSERCGPIARQLQPYIVQVPAQAFAALRTARAVAPVAPERFEDQFMRLANVDLYSERFGLDWTNPEFIQSEHLVW